MSATCIPYTHLPHATALLTDYLYHFDRVSQFYSGSPYELVSYENLASRLKSFPFERQRVSEILERQNRAFGCAEPTLANIQRLRDPGTFAVVTGQQVGLFSGPAFTLYKALTTVKLARHLSEQGLPAVPMFWLATEDHDLEEVCHGAVFDDEYRLVSFRDCGNRPAPRSPVGNVEHDAEISLAIEQVEKALPDGEARSTLMRDLRECYAPSRGWGESFGRFITRLFGRWGVVLIDPLDESVHELGRPVYQQSLEQAEALRAGILQNTRNLLRRGYHAQVHVTDDSALLFLNWQGDRLPLHQRDDAFFVPEGQMLPLAQLQALLEKEPLSFSPNVLFRPVVQDFLLPTISYVAGPAELAYLAQSQPVYAKLGRPQPIIFPRAAFTLLDARTERWMEKYKLRLEDVWQGEEPLSRKVAASAGAEGWSERFDQSERELDQIISRLHEDVEKVDPTLVDTLQHAKEKMKYQLERLRGKMARAALGRSELLTRHVQALTSFLLPHKDLQERRVNGVSFLGRAGYSMLDRLLDHIQVRCSDHQVVKL